MYILRISQDILFDFSLTVKAALHECVIRTGQSYTWVKAENEARFYFIVPLHLSKDSNYLNFKTPAK